MGFSGSKAAVWLLLLSLALSQVAVNGASDKEEIQKALKDMNTLSVSLRDEADKIELNTAKEGGVKVEQGIKAISTRMGHITYYINKMRSALSESDANTIPEFLESFQAAQEETLAVVAGLIQRLPLPFIAPSIAPIREALTTLDSAVKTFSCELVGVIPSQRGSAKQTFRSISDDVNNALAAFSPGYAAA